MAVIFHTPLVLLSVQQEMIQIEDIYVAIHAHLAGALIFKTPGLRLFKIFPEEKWQNKWLELYPTETCRRTVALGLIAEEVPPLLTSLAILPFLTLIP